MRRQTALSTPKFTGFKIQGAQKYKVVYRSPLDIIHMKNRALHLRVGFWDSSQAKIKKEFACPVCKGCAGLTQRARGSIECPYGTCLFPERTKAIYSMYIDYVEPLVLRMRASVRAQRGCECVVLRACAGVALARLKKWAWRWRG